VTAVEPDAQMLERLVAGSPGLAGHGPGPPPGRGPAGELWGGGRPPGGAPAAPAPATRRCCASSRVRASGRAVNCW
jgi:hypothetical protein